jgi:hypothetical protein
LKVGTAQHSTEQTDTGNSNDNLTTAKQQQSKRKRAPGKYKHSRSERRREGACVPLNPHKPRVGRRVWERCKPKTETEL